jgi:hypothetical protein
MALNHAAYEFRGNAYRKIADLNKNGDRPVSIWGAAERL